MDELTTLAEIAQAFGMSRATLSRRIKTNWPGRKLLRPRHKTTDERYGSRTYYVAYRSEIIQWKRRR